MKEIPVDKLLEFVLSDLKDRNIHKTQIAKSLVIGYSTLNRRLENGTDFTAKEFVILLKESGYKLLILKGEIDEIIGNS